MKLDTISEISVGKYNKWCERRPLVCNNKIVISKANKHLTRKELTSTEKGTLFLHDLVNCQGLEFVAFSSARFKKPVVLPGRVVLVPCFLSEIEGKSWKDPLVRLTNRMMEHARFIYDGWVPITDWNINGVREAIRKVDQILTIFSIQERIWFTWEPKYVPSQIYPSSHKIEDHHIQEIQNLHQFIDSWIDDDSKAFYRSVAWLSQSLRLPQAAARFLFCILAIESLATYIEKESAIDSAFKPLRSSQLAGSKRKEQREKCIKNVLDLLLTTDPTKAINSAYLGCVHGIKKMLEDHLGRVFANDHEPLKLLFENKIEGKTLYDLRNAIAHGGIDALSDLQRQRLSNRIWDIERIARRYLVKVLEEIWGKSPFRQKMIKTMMMPFQIVSHEGMYKGPIHMAETYYTQIS